MAPLWDLSQLSIFGMLFPHQLFKVTAVANFEILVQSDMTSGRQDVGMSLLLFTCSATQIR